MKYKLLCLLLCIFLAGCWTTRRAIQDGLETLLVSPTTGSATLIPPPVPAIPTNRPPPKPYTNIFLIWTNPHSLNSFQVYSRTSLNFGQWQLRTGYYPCLTGELRVRFTNNMSEEYFKVFWTNLSFGIGGWL